MTATDSIQNNVSFRLNGTLSTSASSVAISDDTTNGGACAFTNAQITVQSPDGNTFERMVATAAAGTLTIATRGIKLDQVLATDVALKREFRKGSIGYVTYMANQVANASGAQSVTGTWTFTNGVASGSFASDAAADAAWAGGTAPNGAMFYNTGSGRNRIKESGNWVSSTGSVDYATTRVCAAASANNGEWYRDSGNSNALTFKNTSGTSFAFVVDATGKLVTTAYDFAASTDGASAVKPVSPYMAGVLAGFGGTGADGAVDGTGDVTITGSNDTLIEKDYTSWAAGSAPRTFTVTPTGCILRIRIAGGADFTNWTFSLDSKGTVGGTALGAVIASGNAGATSLMGSTGGQGGTAVGATGAGGAGSGASSSSNGTAGAAGAGGVVGAAGVEVKPLATQSLLRFLRGNRIDVGTGGASGANYNATGSSGAGGAGGGCVIFEIAGNVNFGSCTFNARGGNGGNGATQGGGGAGGGGGTVIAIYSGAKTGTYTANVTGGTNGTSANPNSGTAASGPAGIAYDFKRSE